MIANVANAQTTNTESDARELLRRLWPRRWLIVGSTILFACAAAAAAYLMTPIYESKAVLYPARNNKSSGLKSALDQLGGLSALAGMGLKDTDDETQEALGVLKSRQFSDAFISDKDLTRRFFAKRWNPATGTWKGSPDRWPTPGKAFSYFDERVRAINNDKKTGLVTLTIQWKDPEEAAEWANELVARLNAEMRRRAIAQARSNIEYLQQQLNRDNYVEIRDAINHLIEAQLRQEMVASATEQYAFHVVDKAFAADKDSPVRPMKLLMIAGGAACGLLLAILPAFFSGGWTFRASYGAAGIR